MDSAVRSDGRVPDGFFLSRRFLLVDGNTLTQSCRFAATDRSPFKFLTVLTKPPGNKKTDRKKLWSASAYSQIRHRNQKTL